MKYIITMLIFILFIGCKASPEPQKNILQSENLGILLLTFETKIDKNEVKTLSNELLLQSKVLKNRYKLVKPPLFHNFLVNIGIKDRGLCWHFAYDMLNHAKKLNLKSFDYYIGGANIDDYWEEHNSLVITCKGCEFYNGIVVDPWRNSGKLYYSKIKYDKEYNWTQRGDKR